MTLSTFTRKSQQRFFNSDRITLKYEEQPGNEEGRGYSS